MNSPLSRTHWAMCITSCSHRTTLGSPSLSISNFCLVLVWIYFSSSTAALGTSISLSLHIQVSWQCFSFIKISSGSLHCWSFTGMTSFWKALGKANIRSTPCHANFQQNRCSLTHADCSLQNFSIPLLSLLSKQQKWFAARTTSGSVSIPAFPLSIPSRGISHRGFFPFLSFPLINTLIQKFAHGKDGTYFGTIGNIWQAEAGAMEIASLVL